MTTRTAKWAAALLSACAYSAAIWVSGVVPVQFWADARRAENLARNYQPNMDPGVAIVLACFLLLPFALANLAIEVARQLRKGAPLSAPGSLVLGLLAGAPLAYAFTQPAVTPSYAASCAAFVLATVGFYAVRHAWLRRKRVASR